MEPIEQEIRLSRFDRKTSILNMKTSGYNFCWAIKKPTGYIRYCEVVGGNRVYFKNNNLKAYMKPQKGE